MLRVVVGGKGASISYRTVCSLRSLGSLFVPIIDGGGEIIYKFYGMRDPSIQDGDVPARRRHNNYTIIMSSERARQSKELHVDARLLVG